MPSTWSFILGRYWRCWSSTGANGSTWCCRWPTATALQRRLLFLLIVASVPGAIIGVLLEKQAETIFRSPMLIAGTMATLGILLWAADAYWVEKAQDRRPHLPRRHTHRPQPGVRDYPRRLALRRDDYHGPLPRHRARRCGEFFVPDGDARLSRAPACSKRTKLFMRASPLSSDGASRPPRCSV